MSIEVQEVSKLYGKQKALNKVSFKAVPGEIIGFLGPNGAGKSTMMKIITGFLPANEGEVSVCGLNVIENALAIKAKIGYLPEHNPLYDEMYIKEYLHFVAGIFKVKNAKERIAELIQLVGLELEQHKKIAALSKGYRQRVGLAQALLHDPEVLILDEPTTGLDPNQLEEIRQLIKNIGKKKTVMLSTHIMQEVEAICDRVIIINHGEIVANEKTSQLSELLQDDLQVQVEFAKAIDKKDLKKIAAVNGLEEKGENTFIIRGKDGELRNALFEYAQKNGNEILSLQKESQRLENIFKELTKRK